MKHPQFMKNFQNNCCVS